MSKTQAALAAERLPFNRKEKYFTGTVLPGILTGHGFGPLNDFLSLCGLDAAVDPEAAEPDLQFFTEYNFAESVYTEQDHQRWPKPFKGDTPDLVLTGPDWLLVVEAKMYDHPSEAALRKQLRRQQKLVNYWSDQLQLDSGRVRHVLLVPDALETQAKLHAAKGRVDQVVTWQAVLDMCESLPPGLWQDALRHALDEYAQLAAKPSTFGANADAFVTGQQIVDQHTPGSPAATFTWMGRQSGINGKFLSHDIHTEEWRGHTYEVRRQPLPGNPNWFPIDDFLKRLGSTAPGHV